MLQTVSIKDTRENLAELIDRVAISGEEFVVTKFGKPRAMIVPVSGIVSGIDNKAMSEVFGAWLGRGDIANSAEWVKKTRRNTSLRGSND